jgi:hypothetical protein
MTPIIIRLLSRYSDIKFPNERTSHPSQETAISAKLQLKKDKELLQKNRQIKMQKRSRKREI